MESILENLMNNPLYMVGAIVLVLVVLIFLVKKVFKVLMIILVLGGIFLGYLYFFDQEAFQDLQDKIKGGKEQLKEFDEATKDYRGGSVDEAIKDAQEKLKKKF